MTDTATLSALSALADRMPDAARDIRLNLQSVLDSTTPDRREIRVRASAAGSRRPSPGRESMTSAAPTPSRTGSAV